MAEISEDRGLLYAEACFETVRVLEGSVFNWPAHERRLRSGLSAFGLKLPDGMQQRCMAEADRVGLDATVRLTATGAQAPAGLMPASERGVAVYFRSRPYKHSAEDVRLRTVRWPMPLYSRPAKFSADYAHTIRCLLRLEQDGLLNRGEEALICDRMCIYSACTSNAMFFQDGEWLTPDGDMVLPGVIREALIAQGCVKICRCPLDLADTCDAVALTNSVWFVRPVASINGRGLKTDGPPFDRLRAVLYGNPGVPGDLACG